MFLSLFLFFWHWGHKVCIWKMLLCNLFWIRSGSSKQSSAWYLKGCPLGLISQAQGGWSRKVLLFLTTARPLKSTRLTINWDSLIPFISIHLGCPSWGVPIPSVHQSARWFKIYETQPLWNQTTMFLFKPASLCVWPGLYRRYSDGPRQWRCSRGLLPRESQ